MEPTNVCILGMGLIGGSLMRDLAADGAPVFGWNRSAVTVDAAQAEGFDVSGDLPATLRRANESQALIVIATPLFTVGDILDAIAEHAPDCGITDVVSVKTAVQEEVNARGLQDSFVGSHPMAGLADAGWSATLTGLFTGAAWVVTYDTAEAALRDGTEPSEHWLTVFRQVVELALSVGSEVVPARSYDHDRSVARVSHVPHVLARALSLVGESGGPLAFSLAAGSYRDSTRVAGSPPDLVRAMCEGNTGPVVEALDELLAHLVLARDELVEHGTVETLAIPGTEARLHFEELAGRTSHGGSESNRPVVAVDLHAPAGELITELQRAESEGARIVQLDSGTSIR